MQASRKRHIKSGQQFHGFFPMATGADTVIKTTAHLEHTLELMRAVIADTAGDTVKIAKHLRADSVMDTCRRIWQFVYNHIGYRPDKSGVEQVRRPSRSWKDRSTGVDCDCYSVFISSILLNLGIAHKLRITKYNGKSNFQHVYPIVPTTSGHITLDCVTDAFDHEVPYTAHRDIDISLGANKASLSGVDVLALGHIKTHLQPRLPLLEKQHPNCYSFRLPICTTNPSTAVVPSKKPVAKPIKRLRSAKNARVLSPYDTIGVKHFSGSNGKLMPSRYKHHLFYKTIIALGLGYGTYRLVRMVTKK